MDEQIVEVEAPTVYKVVAVEALGFNCPSTYGVVVIYYAPIVKNEYEITSFGSTLVGAALTQFVPLYCTT